MGRDDISPRFSGNNKAFWTWVIVKPASIMSFLWAFAKRLSLVPSAFLTDVLVLWFGLLGLRGDMGACRVTIDTK